MPLQALAVCVIGGAVFQFLRTPLPWMIGPLAAMALLNFSGVRLHAPKGGRELGQLVIGTALGLYFTPQVAGEVLGTWPVLIAAVLLATALGWICALFLSRFTDTDRTTAFFASVPGGATEMSILGERFGAKADRIALAKPLQLGVPLVTAAHVTWVLILVTTTAPLFRLARRLGTRRT